MYTRLRLVRGGSGVHDVGSYYLVQGRTGELVLVLVS